MKGKQAILLNKIPEGDSTEWNDIFKKTPTQTYTVHTTSTLLFG